MITGIRTRRLVAVLALSLCATACTGGDEPAQDDGFLAISDCRELERLASIEVDRINNTTSNDVATAATARFQRIVTHRDSIC